MHMTLVPTLRSRSQSKVEGQLTNRPHESLTLLKCI